MSFGKPLALHLHDLPHEILLRIAEFVGALEILGRQSLHQLPGLALSQVDRSFRHIVSKALYGVSPELVIGHVPQQYGSLRRQIWLSGSARNVIVTMLSHFEIIGLVKGSERCTTMDEMEKAIIALRHKRMDITELRVEEGLHCHQHDMGNKAFQLLREFVGLCNGNLHKLSVNSQVLDAIHNL